MNEKIQKKDSIIPSVQLFKETSFIIKKWPVKKKDWGFYQINETKMITLKLNLVVHGTQGLYMI